MIDHVLVFASEDAAKTELARFCPNGNWDESVCIPGIELITANEVWDTSDLEHTILVSPKQTLPGWWIAIALSELDADLTAMTATRFAASRELAASGQSPFVYMAQDLNVALLVTARISPVFAGSAYRFE